MILFLIGVLIAAIVFPILVGSLGGCFPGWWKAKVAPRLRNGLGSIEDWLDRHATDQPRFPWLTTFGSWLWTAVVWLTSPVWFPLKMLGIGWARYAEYIIDGIKGICPYTCEHGKPVVDHCPECRLDELREASTPDPQPHW